MSGTEVAKNLSRILHNKEEQQAFLDEMSCDHRTLQQDFTRLCVRWFQFLATSRFDGRNEASVKLAQAIAPILDNHCLPRI